MKKSSNTKVHPPSNTFNRATHSNPNIVNRKTASSAHRAASDIKQLNNPYYQDSTHKKNSNNYPHTSSTSTSNRTTSNVNSKLNTSNAFYNQERQCDSCRYKVPLNECSSFRCKDCGPYLVSTIILSYFFKEKRACQIPIENLFSIQNKQ